MANSTQQRTSEGGSDVESSVQERLGTETQTGTDKKTGKDTSEGSSTKQGSRSGTSKTTQNSKSDSTRTSKDDQVSENSQNSTNTQTVKAGEVKRQTVSRGGATVTRDDVGMTVIFTLTIGSD